MERAVRERAVTTHLCLLLLPSLALPAPPASACILKTFSCRSLADGTRWMRADLSVRCGDDTVQQTYFSSAMRTTDYESLALLYVFAFVAGVPLLFFLVMFFHRNQLFVHLGMADDVRAQMLHEGKCVYEKGERVPMRAITSGLVEETDIAPDPIMKVELGFLYIDYDPPFYYWET